MGPPHVVDVDGEEAEDGPLEISVETSSRKIAKSDVDDARAKSKRMTVKTQNGT